MIATNEPTCDSPKCKNFVEGEECFMTGRMCEHGQSACQCHDPEE